MKLKKRQIFRFFKRVLILVLFLAFLGGLGFFLQTDWFKVKKVTCQLDGQDCSDQLFEEVRSLVLGKSIIFLPSQEIREQILTAGPVLSQVEIKKIFPQQLFFELEKREPTVALVLVLEADPEKQASSSALPGSFVGDQFLVFGPEGVLLLKTDQTDLPLLLVKQLPVLNIGDRLESDQIRQGIKVLSLLPFYLVEAEQGEIVSSWSLVVWLRQETKVLFSLKKELEIQLDSLQLIFSRAKIDGRIIKQLDLRFDKPVVIYE